MDDRLRIIYQRRSIRRFKSQPVEPQAIVELLRAAMAAPSARDRQPWRFLVVTNEPARQQLASALPNAAFAAEAGVVIFIYGEPNTELFDQDLAAATENLLIAAAELGLGTCWCGVTDERRPSMHKITGIPENQRIVSMICIGHPAESKPARTQYDATKVFWERIN
ncbi:nitroreductase family protein [bacterium]|nr:nitroreductase family protein [bacterium]